MSSETAIFTRKDRDLMRLEFMQRFGSATSIHEGMLVRRWKSGPLKEQPKVSAGVQSLIDRGLVTLVDDGSGFPRARFTEAGLRALVAMADDPRAFRPPERYVSLLAEIAEVRRTLSQHAECH
jgi:hypothetical protein